MKPNKPNCLLIAVALCCTTLFVDTSNGYAAGNYRTRLTAAKDTVLKPTAAQLRYSESEPGVIIHLDLEIYKPEIFWKQHMGKENISKPCL